MMFGCSSHLCFVSTPPSVLKQLPSTPELPVRLSGLPAPGIEGPLSAVRVFLSNLGNDFSVGVVAHHTDPPNLACAWSETPRDLNQVILHGVATHCHEVDTLGYLDRVHSRQPGVKVTEWGGGWWWVLYLAFGSGTNISSPSSARPA